MKEYEPKLHKVSFVGASKRKLERGYGLAEGSLDTPEGKAIVMPDLGITFGEFLVQAYHAFQKLAPEYHPERTRQDAMKALAAGRPVCFTDIRNHLEAVVITELSKSYPVILCEIVSPSQTSKSSDLLLPDLVRMICPVARQHFIVMNDKDILHLNLWAKLILSGTLHVVNRMGYTRETQAE
jgi:hypothetical protein